jgi:hypothetical protein
MKAKELKTDTIRFTGLVIVPVLSGVNSTRSTDAMEQRKKILAKNLTIETLRSFNWLVKFLRCTVQSLYQDSNLNNPVSKCLNRLI